MLTVAEAVKTSANDLRSLPTTARSRIDANDVVAPPGYTVEAVAAGLSFPCGMTLADDGTIFITEGGTTWPTRPWMPPRLLRLDTDGKMRVLAIEEEGGLRGVAYHNGYVYATAKGGYTSRVLRFHPKTGERTVLIDKLPAAVRQFID